MNNKLILCMLIFTLSACLSSGSKNQPQVEEDSIPELTLAEQQALEAFNTLQMGTDEKNRLYSTFAGIDHSCYPADTILNITQPEFLEVMNQFVSIYCKAMTFAEKNDLATKAAQAQAEYKVAICFENGNDMINEQGIPLKGIWIFPNLLERRDVILEW